MRLSPAARKLTLTVHVAAGVGWLGVLAVLILLATTGLTTGDETMLDAVSVTAGEVVWLVFPFAALSLASMAAYVAAIGLGALDGWNAITRFVRAAALVEPDPTTAGAYHLA